MIGDDTAPPVQSRAMFDRLKRFDFGLRRTREAVFGRVAQVFDRRAIDDAFWDELEETLIGADLSVGSTEELVLRLRNRIKEEQITEVGKAKEVLKEEMVGMLTEVEEDDEVPFERFPSRLEDGRPFVLLIVGVNGTGKTTTIAKLAKRFKERRLNVVLGAADTFRAAAIDQIKVWGDRIGVEVIAHKMNAAPSGVAYDAVAAGKARNADVVIVDTAGRLQNKSHLMKELESIEKSIKKVDPTAPHQSLLIVDATTGQNGILQTEAFAAASNIDGIVLTKLDGTAKGGIAFTIANELGLPIRYIGTGEKVDDIADFDAAEYVRQLFE